MQGAGFDFIKIALMSTPRTSHAIRFPHRHLLGIKDLSATDIDQLLDLADSYGQFAHINLCQSGIVR